MEQRSPEWFAARRGRITGSMVGALLGMSPYLTEEFAFRTLVRSMHDADREFMGNVATEWGQQNEEGAKFSFEIETGLTVKAVSFFPKEDWAGASPDGVVSDGGLIEIKCPYSLRKEPSPVFKTAEVQEHYYAQMQFQMYCTGHQHCHFYQWAPHGSSHEVVQKDYEWLDEYIPKLRQIYQQATVADPADHIGPARPVLSGDQGAKMVQEWDEITEQIELLANRKKDLLNEMVQFAGGRNAMIAGRRLTLVKVAGRVSYAKAIKELAPNADLSKWRGPDSETWRVH